MLSDLTRNLLPTLRQTGHAYPALEKELAGLSLPAQQDLLRLVRDLTGERDRYRRQARMGLPL